MVSHCVDLRSNLTRLELLLSKSFDGPITDIEDDPEDDVEDIAPSQNSLGFSPPHPSLGSSISKTAASNKRARSRRLVTRSAAQESNNSHLKAVSLKRRAEAPPRKIPFSVARDLRASKPGWTGSSAELGSLNNRKVVSLEEAKDIGLVELAWDGR